LTGRKRPVQIKPNCSEGTTQKSKQRLQKTAHIQTSSSATAERPRDESTILRRWITLRLNFTLKGYISCHYLWTIGWENGYTTTLLLEVFA